MKKTNKNTTTSSSSSSASASASIIINNSQINKSSSNFEEAKKNFLKIRKRKERQESVNSLNQDRKIIRSNSEERPSSSSSSLSIMINCEDDSSHIRRVSSSGDFPKTAAPQQQQEEKSSSANKPVLLLKYDDYEHEKMRSNERHTFKSRKSNRKFKLRGTMKINNNNNNNNNKEKQPSSSSSTTSEMIMENSSSSAAAAAAAHQDLPDFSTLYRANEEPVLSLPVCDDQPTIMTNKIPISPRNSIIAMERIYLERNLPQVVIKNPLDERLRKLTKQINSFKKKILLYENDFELQTGTKPTQMEKMNDFPLRKLYVELSRLKREKQQLEEISSNNSNKIILNTHHYHHYNNKEVIGLERTIEEIEERLQLKREHATRDIQSLNSNQLIEQKVATQKALLYLESVHGRPQNKEDRDLVRPFYDRYRQLKQMVNSSIELATIDENEAMQHFIPSASSSNETESYSSEQTEKPTSSSFISAEDDHDDIMMVSWHSLNKQELLIKLKEINAERNELKKKIKDFENGIIKIAKNKLTKDDKKPMEDIYISYKKVKKRLKLIQVLVGKFRT